VGNASTWKNEDVGWMRQALVEAAKGRGWVEPNPLVGAVVVRDGQLVGAGYHERFGGAHAEVNALKLAGEAARGATLFVTLEPCCHFGKTPPCTDAILAAEIARVVAAMRDPFPRVNGGGLAILAAAGLTVEVGCEADRARTLNAPYLKRLITGLPYVTAKWAMTLDGKTATISGDSRWISSEFSRNVVHNLRGRMDAILVGIGTIEADDPLLTARIPDAPRQPVRVVLDGSARLSTSSRLVRTTQEIPVLVAVTDRATGSRRETLARAGCEIVAFPGRGVVPIVRLLEELGRRGMSNVLVEGGGRTAGSFFDAGQVDAVDVFIAPILEGGDHPRTPLRGRGSSLMSQASKLQDIQSDPVGQDTRIRGRLVQPWWIAAGFGAD
jgi:diaminohydroxyphosphoribosylaminopyrimidine deaminase / 5-amino-6-(5-phosphoribosylamino)uracil reductase